MDNRNSGRGPHTGDIDEELPELLGSLREACGAHREWPAKVAAGIYAALEFASADPERARQLLARDTAGERGFAQTVSSLGDLLERTVTEEGVSPNGGGGPVQGIAMIVSDHIRSERADDLAQIGPALVQFALQPYLGYAEAKHWADVG